jgi:hypothetical protein
VYFIKSGVGCGTSVRLMQWIGSGDPTILYFFDSSTDVGYTSLFDDGAGNVTIYANFYFCDTGESDIYSFVFP